jgi:WD40 repeat protein
LDIETREQSGELYLNSGRVIGLTIFDAVDVYWCSDCGHLGRALLQSRPEIGALPRLVEVWRDDTSPGPHTVLQASLANEGKSSLNKRTYLAVSMIKCGGANWLVSVDSSARLQWHDPRSGKVCFEHLVVKDADHRSTLATLVHFSDRDGFAVALNHGRGCHLTISEEDPLARTFGAPGLPVDSHEALGLKLVHRTVPGWQDSTGAITVSPDGKVLFGSVQVWTQSGIGRVKIESVRLFDDHSTQDVYLESAEIRCLHAVSSETVVAGHALGLVDVVNIAKKRQLGRYTVSAGCFCVRQSPDGLMIVSGHDDGSVCFWLEEDLLRYYGQDTWHRGPIVSLEIAESRSLFYARGRRQRFIRETDKIERLTYIKSFMA